MKEIPKLQPFCPCPVCKGTTIDTSNNTLKCLNCEREWTLTGTPIYSLEEKLEIVRDNIKQGKPLSLWPPTFKQALEVIAKVKKENYPKGGG